MKAKVILGYSLVCFLLIGCANPFKKFISSKNKIQETEKKIDDKDSLRAQYSIGYVYGANRALQQDPEPSKYVSLAKDLTEKSLIITGLPKPKEVADFQKIVDGSLSTNKIDNELAEKLLKKKDSEIISLYKDIDSLNRKLESQEKAFEKQAESNAKDAQLMVNIRRWIRIAGFTILGFIGIRIVSVFIPQLAPIGMLIDILAGGMFKVFSKALPKAKEAAGLVTKETYDISEKTLSQLVDAIQTARQQNSTVKSVIDPILKDITDKDVTRPKILEVKKGLGYI